MVEWGGHHGDWGGFGPPSYIVKKCPDPGMILVTGFDVLFLLTYSAMSSYQFIVTSEQSS